MRLNTFVLAAVAQLAAASEVALYWGQGGGSSLGDYCKNSAGDIYIVSFLYQFGEGEELALEVGGCNGADFSGTELPQCSNIGSDIQTCQQLGKKVFVSLGGASGSYGFSSADDASNVAKEIWNDFGGGESSTRPFGSAKVDGFDLDIESPTGAAYYGDFVNALRSEFSSDSSKQYYISAAPQCPFPDQDIGQALDSGADFDYIFVQFYNNYCSLNGKQFNWDTWQKWAESAKNDPKLFVGLPGSTSAAGSGYVTPGDLKNGLSQVTSSQSFGGVMLWDASRAGSNIVDGGVSYDKYVRQVLDSFGGSPSSSAVPTSVSESSSTVAPTSNSVTTSGELTSSVAVPSEALTSSANVTTSPGIEFPSGILPSGVSSWPPAVATVPAGVSTEVPAGSAAPAGASAGASAGSAAGSAGLPAGPAVGSPAGSPAGVNGGLSATTTPSSSNPPFALTNGTAAVASKVTSPPLGLGGDTRPSVQHSHAPPFGNATTTIMVTARRTITVNGTYHPPSTTVTNTKTVSTVTVRNTTTSQQAVAAPTNGTRPLLAKRRPVQALD